MRLIDADRINIKDVIGGNSEFANDVRIAEGCRKKMRKDEVRCNENTER